MYPLGRFFLVIFLLSTAAMHTTDDVRLRNHIHHVRQRILLRQKNIVHKLKSTNAEQVHMPDNTEIIDFTTNCDTTHATVTDVGNGYYYHDQKTHVQQNINSFSTDTNDHGYNAHSRNVDTAVASQADIVPISTTPFITNQRLCPVAPSSQMQGEHVTEKQPCCCTVNLRELLYRLDVMYAHIVTHYNKRR